MWHHSPQGSQKQNWLSGLLCWAASPDWGSGNCGANLWGIIARIWLGRSGSHSSLCLLEVLFEASKTLKCRFFTETPQIFHEKNIIHILYSFWKPWLWIFTPLQISKPHSHSVKTGRKLYSWNHTILQRKNIYVIEKIGSVVYLHYFIETCMWGYIFTSVIICFMVLWEEKKHAKNNSNKY